MILAFKPLMPSLVHPTSKIHFWKNPISLNQQLTTEVTFNLFFSLKIKMQFKFFYLFVLQLIVCPFKVLHKRKRRTLIRGVKGPKKSFNTFLIKSHFLVLSFSINTSQLNLLMVSYLLHQNYFNLFKVWQTRKRAAVIHLE